MADPAVLRLENLSKRFSADRPPIFEGISLDLRQGEYLGCDGRVGWASPPCSICSPASINRIPAECRWTASISRCWTTMPSPCCGAGQWASSSKPFTCCPI